MFLLYSHVVLVSFSCLFLYSSRSLRVLAPVSRSAMTGPTIGVMSTPLKTQLRATITIDSYFASNTQPPSSLPIPGRTSRFPYPPPCHSCTMATLRPLTPPIHPPRTNPQWRPNLTIVTNTLSYQSSTGTVVNISSIWAKGISHQYTRGMVQSEPTKSTNTPA